MPDTPSTGLINKIYTCDHFKYFIRKRHTLLQGNQKLCLMLEVSRFIPEYYCKKSVKNIEYKE